MTLKEQLERARRSANGYWMTGAEEDYTAQCALSAVRDVLDILEELVARAAIK